MGSPANHDDGSLTAKIRGTAAVALVLHPDLTVHEVSGSFAALLRQSPESLKGQPLWQNFAGAEASRFYGECRRAMAEQSAARFDDCYVPLDLWLEIFAYPSVDGLAIDVRNIIECQLADEQVSQLYRDLALRNSQLETERARWKGMIEGIADEVWIADKDGRMTLVNEPAVPNMGLEGFRDKQNQVNDVVEILNPDGQPRSPADAPLLQALRGERRRGQEMIRHRATGRIRWREFFASPTRDAAGAIIGAVAVIRDITEHKQLVQALRASEQSMRQLADAMPQIVWAARADGYIDYFNARWYELTGAPHGEAGDDSWKKAMHPDDRELCRTKWADAVRSGQPHENESRFRFKDTNDYRWHLVRALPIRDSAEKILRWMGTCTDIDDLRRAQESLTAAKQSADEANAAKDQFLAVLSHELRTPLTPVLGAVAIIGQIPNLPAEVRQSMEIIQRNAILEARLIDDLLDVTRIAKGKLDLECKPADVFEVLDRAVEVCNADIEAKRVHLTVKREDQLLTVNADVARLQQVFWNLVKNAVKFTPEGGSIEVLGFAEGDLAVIEVRDSGIGIAAEDLERLFGAFEQLEQAAKFGGLGLGLAISKRLVEMHGGDIFAQSDGKGRGATFRVTLPRLAGAVVKAETRAVSEGETAPKRILLVEDHSDTLQMIQLLLESWGHEVITAGDVSQALAAAGSRHFDIVISDLGLPDRTGYELMQELRQHDGHVKGIALSGYAQEADIRKSVDSGFSEHIAKPVEFDTLRDAIVRVAR